MTLSIDPVLYRELTTGLRLISEADNPVDFLLGCTFYNNGDISRISGLNSTTVRKIREGKKASKAHMAALKYVLLVAELRLPRE